MSETQHTPGPWFVFDNEHCVGGPYDHPEAPDSKTAGIALCNMRLRPSQENVANARLIAAAPDLLAACADLLAFSEEAVTSPNTTLGRLCAVARDAIALATGVKAGK